LKPRSQDFVLSGESPEELVDKGMRRQLLGYGDTIMMARVSFDKDAVGVRHNHPHAQVTYVVSGVFDVFIDGVERQMKAGDSFYIHPNNEHGAVCREPGVLIDVFSPAREDFLSEEN